MQDKNISNIPTMTAIEELRLKKESIMKSQEIKEKNIKDINNLNDATFYVKELDKQISDTWFKLSHALKKIRDENLYEEKYTSFQDYFETELNYKKTMVYNFIKIAETFNIDTKQELINLGVSKLVDLVELNENDRNEFLNTNNVEEMSFRDVKKKLKEYKNNNYNNYNENITFSNDEFKHLKNFNENINKFHNSIKTFTNNQNEDSIIDYEKLYYMNDILSKTEKDIKLLKKKILKKYL
jgi:hypothetical protein